MNVFQGRQIRRKRVLNPFGRFAGTKYELMQGGADVLSWEYDRASSDPYGTSKSVGDQSAIATTQRERFGWTHAQKYEDNNLGASRQAIARGVVRENFEQMLTAIKTGVPGDVIILWELSRSQRDMAVYIQIRDLCIDYGPYFWLVGGELYDVRNRNDRASLGFQAQQAEQTGDGIAEGTKRGLKFNAEAGKPHGPIIFGYTRTYDPRSGRFVSQELDFNTYYIDGDGNHVLRIDYDGQTWSPAGIAQEMFDDALALVPIRTICRRLTERGIPTPRQMAASERNTPKGPERWKHVRWEGHTVRNILTNPAYIGLRLSDGAVAKADAWPALVSEEEFYGLLNVLKAPDRSRKLERPNQAKYLLTNIAQCWICKDAMAHQKPSHSSHVTPFYKCRNFCSSILRPVLDEQVEATVLAFLSDPDELAALLALGRSAPEIEAARAEYERLRVDLADTKARIRTAPRDDLDDLEFRRDNIRTQLAMAEAKMVSTDLPAELGQFVGTSVVEALRVWSSLELAAQRGIVKATLDIWLYPAGQGCRNVPLSDRILIEAKTREKSVAEEWATRCEALLRERKAAIAARPRRRRRAVAV